MYKNYERATRVVPRITVQERNGKDVECDGVRDNKRRDVARGVLSSFANESKRSHIVAGAYFTCGSDHRMTSESIARTAGCYGQCFEACLRRSTTRSKVSFYFFSFACV